MNASTGGGSPIGGTQTTTVHVSDYDPRAYAEVTRERVDNLAEQVERLETKINTLMFLVVGQMIAFIFGVVLFILNHVHF
jgi:hypothetical protein